MNNINIKDFISKLKHIEEQINDYANDILLNIKTFHDNNICPCGSEKLYSKCCKSKVTEMYSNLVSLGKDSGSDAINEYLSREISNYIENGRQSKTPSQRVYKKSLEKKNIKLCLTDYHYGNYNNSVVYAHSITQDPILNNLSNKDMLITFNRHISIPKDSVEKYFEEITVDKASVVNTFCTDHDKELFNNIENSNSYNKSFIQDLQFTLKCISVSVYCDILQVLHMQIMLKECTELWFETKLFQDYGQHIKNLECDYNTSQEIIENIKNNRNILTTFSFELKNYVEGFAACETKMVNMDTKGDIINEPCLHFINVIPTSNSTLFILSAISTELSTNEVFCQLKNMLLKNEHGKILTYFSKLISEKGSNIYFSKLFFNKLDEVKKVILYFHYSKNGAERIAIDIYKNFLQNIKPEILTSMYRNILFKDFHFLSE